jgi:hypothetical protein
VCGHGRLEAALIRGDEEVPTIDLSHLSERQARAYVIADNKIATNAGWNLEVLSAELSALAELDFDVSKLGFDEQEIDAMLKGDEKLLPGNNSQLKVTVPAGSTSDTPPRKNDGSLSEKFMIPPFSVLDARSGWWQRRKAAWLGLGLKSELGRAEELVRKGEELNKGNAHGYRKERKKKKVATTSKDLVESRGGTSIFDPVLCEVVYRWFCPKEGEVQDPFHGGEVRGVVASQLGLKYTGVDLSERQTAANIAHGLPLCKNNKYAPDWRTGDSLEIESVAPGKYDFLFSCPPYADLEKYSDLPNDISNMDYVSFLEVYRQIIAASVRQLKHNRFACFVVGNVRDKNGYYLDLVGDTVRAFEDTGMHYYGDAVLTVLAGSAPLRAGRQFSNSRKLAKTHQNILVFVKGDPVRTAEAMGEVDMTEVLPDE